MLFLLGSLFWLLGLNFLFYDYSVLVDWEILNINSCSLVFTLFFDFVSLIFMGCVLYISAMVVYYSKSYIRSDIYRVRFLFLVLIFVLSILFIIISPNLIRILLGWDGLGLVSYCLVIYFQNYKSYASGILTILTNRIGDVAILLRIAWFVNFGRWNFIYYLRFNESWVPCMCIILVLAGFTKSAQIPFSSWLPAAMAAPTPVSALVHSSTLVTAGVYLMIRFRDLYLHYNCKILALIGLLTMFISGAGANLEFDLKKIIALSTLSQLGLIMAILFLGYPLLSYFHLLTHAFFKALLFLCAGLIIHCIRDRQDIRHIGGVSYFLPFTSTCFVISSLSLCGAPFLSGFYSKDFILEIYRMSGLNFIMYVIFFISVGLTVSYSFRLVYYCISYYRLFYVNQRYDEDKVINFSIILLTFLSIFGGRMLGWLLFPPSLVILPLLLKIMALIIISLGAFLGYELSRDLAANQPYNYLLINYFGSIWFIPQIRTYIIYNKVLPLSKSYINILDMGWGERLVSKYLGYLSVYLSKINQNFQYNNLKIIILGVLILFFLVTV